ncbi:MAG: hypothetical protein RRY79_00620 [Clostridia bacterium]
MSSIIDMVANAETEAAKIRALGAEEASALIFNANAEAKRQIALSKTKSKDYTISRREQSDRQGRRVYLDIQTSKLKDADAFCIGASANIEKSVSYIVERITR